MSHPLRQTLNAYFENALDHALQLPDADLLAKQRANFLREFDPDRLRTLSPSELLRALPYNKATDRPMDYWLEFRNDDRFSTPLFGGIAGGSAAKFGTWQDRIRGRWHAKPPGSRCICEIDEAEALEIVQERRREMLAAVEALRPFTRCPVEHLDPAEVQAAVDEAAPRWGSSAWLHKYLHLNFPELVTWRASRTYLQSDLQRLGMIADGSGLYALDVKLIQIWSDLPALSPMPIALRYRLTQGLNPRQYWCFRLSAKTASSEWMLANGAVALGPARIGNLAGVLSLSRKTEARRGIESAFRESGMIPDSRSLQNLCNLGYGLREGDLLALVEDDQTVLALGEASGSYRYVFHGECPHRVPVNWLYQGRFPLSMPVKGNGALFRIRLENQVIAELESALWLNGKSGWPGFSSLPQRRKQTDTYAPSIDLLGQPQDEIVHRVTTMLARKKQVVLYGPPGTGKTHYATRTALELVARTNFHRTTDRLSESQRDRIWNQDGDRAPYIALCTFHPLYGYEDFVEGYRPEREGFSLRPGIFRRLVTAAQARPDKCFIIIIDEINRGNIPKIFGELITLLESSQRGNIQVQLPLSGERFSVPANLYLIGTMNTADRSIVLLDTALRRRFGFLELMPNSRLLEATVIGSLPLAAWLEALNRRIMDHLGSDGRNLQIGHAYLMVDGRPVTDIRRFAEIFREDIWPLLQEYCYEDMRMLTAILGGETGGVYDPHSRDLRHDYFEPGREDDLIAALKVIIEPQKRKNRKGYETAGQEYG